ncbi:MAG: extracellular solute-binding protein [Phycisphaerae bacterium]|nr:extracellular solute-binding protein [Phycisphaerae bacterium]
MQHPCKAARIGVVIVGIIVSLAGCGRKAPTDREVVVYCSVDQEVAEPILAAFEKQTGIRAAARFDTEASKTVGLVQKLRAEAKHPAADVFWSGEIFYTIQLANEGLLAAYSSQITKDWPIQFRNSEGQWFGFALRGRVICYHTGRVAKEEAPKSLEDLLDSKWKGKIVMARPSRGTTGGDVASWFVEYGTEKATEILKGLKVNEVRLVEGNSTAVRMVGTGQADICLTDTDDVYAGIRNGWPVAMEPLRRNNKGTLAIPNTAAKIKGGPNPATADRLMEFLLGGECERMLLASDSHNWPVRATTGPEEQKFAISDPAAVDYATVAAALPTALKTVEEVFD